MLTDGNRESGNTSLTPFSDSNKRGRSGGELQAWGSGDYVTVPELKELVVSFSYKLFRVFANSVISLGLLGKLSSKVMQTSLSSPHR